MVTLKGTKDGILIILGSGEWRAVLRDLAEQLARPNASSFFQGASVILDTGERAMSAFAFKELSDLLARYEMRIARVESRSDQTLQVAHTLELSQR